MDLVPSPLICFHEYKWIQRKKQLQGYKDGGLKQIEIKSRGKVETHKKQKKEKAAEQVIGRIWQTDVVLDWLAVFWFMSDVTSSYSACRAIVLAAWSRKCSNSLWRVYYFGTWDVSRSPCAQKTAYASCPQTKRACLSFKGSESY